MYITGFLLIELFEKMLYNKLKILNMCYNTNIFENLLNWEGFIVYVPLLLTQFLDRAVKLYGSKTAVIDDERVFTYSELNERINRLSHGLKDLGVEKGDKVAYLAPNTLEMLEGFYGVFQLGAITVPPEHSA